MIIQSMSLTEFLVYFTPLSQQIPCDILIPLSDLRYADCCWISLVEGGSNWSLMATVNLSVRSDTGLINNPPICSMQPVVRMKQRCSYSMKIPGKVLTNCFAYSS